MTAFADLAQFAALPRIAGLTLSPDGTRLVAAVQHPDAAAARYTTALWDIDRSGGAPTRLTWSDRGETSPAFGPDGTLLFVSTRADPAEPDGEQDEARLWALPAGGEARVLARRPGGLSGPVVARADGAVLLAGSRLTHSAAAAHDADDDAERRAEPQAAQGLGDPAHRDADPLLGPRARRRVARAAAARPGRRRAAGPGPGCR